MCQSHYAMPQHSPYLVHGEVREEDHKVLFHTHNEARVTLKSPSNHFHMVPHLEVFPQLLGWELQHVLEEWGKGL